MGGNKNSQLGSRIGQTSELDARFTNDKGNKAAK